MRNLVFLFFALLMPGCDTPMRKVVSDKSLNGPYVVIKIMLNENVHSVAIQNAFLFFQFKEDLGLSKNNYEEKLLIHLHNNIPFKVSNIDELKGYFVNSSDQMDTIKARGKNNFLNYYFKNKVLIKNLNYEEEKYLIKVLFDWKVLVKRDDESGRLVIYNWYLESINDFVRDIQRL